MNEQEARFLLDHADWVSEVTLKLSEGHSELSLRQKLERDLTPEFCRVLLDCATARNRFSQKLWRGEDWLLSGTAGEQASPWQIARWRAQALGEAGREGGKLVEVGCSVGGDTGFLTRHFEVTAYEMDPGRALLCPFNVNLAGRAERLNVVTEEVRLEALSGNILFCDPARRSHKRLSSPSEWSPPLHAVLDSHTSGRFAWVAVKCAPGLDLDELPQEMQASFLSLDGDLKECFLLAGDGPTGSQAVLLQRDGSATIYCTRGEDIPEALPAPGKYLFNPNPAILRASALDALAMELGAGQPHPRIGYLVGPIPYHGPAAQGFLITDTFPLKWPTLKRRLSSTGWSEYEYLGRGVPFGQTEVRAKLPKLSKGKGEPKRGAVVIYRDHYGYTVVLGERIAGTDSKAL